MSGVSCLIYDYLTNFDSKRYLYLNLSDLRIDKKEIQNNLEQFIFEKKIKILILENYDTTISLPKVSQIILTSNKEISVRGLEKKSLYPLDFEEYISIEQKSFSIKQQFANYSNSSTYPEILLYKFDKIKLYQDRLKSLFDAEIEMEIIKELAKFQSEKISIFQIFNILKSKHKISKDRFYKFINKIEDEKFIFLLSKYGSIKGAKKLYLLDFNLKNQITFKKNFIKRFENILFLELIKREKKVFYADNINFFLPNENVAIISIPFLPIEMINEKIKKITKKNNLNLKKIFVVTMNEKKFLIIDNLPCHILPFWDFVLTL